MTLVLRYTRLGHHLYAVGGNREVARMSGVRTAVPVIAAHVTLLAAGRRGRAAAPAPRTGVGLPTIGSQGRYDLLSIAAVVLGGTLLAGGKGSVVGTLGGVAIFAVLDNVMGVMQVNPFLKDFVRGLVIVLAVAVYARRSVVRRPPRFGARRPTAPPLKEDARSDDHLTDSTASTRCRATEGSRRPATAARCRDARRSGLPARRRSSSSPWSGSTPPSASRRS